MSDTMTLYKLIILKMLSQADTALSNSRIVEFILENEYTSYFTIQQVLSEMQETGLVTVSSSRNASYYHITESGRETLEYFGGKISDAICRDISAYLSRNSAEIRYDLSVTAFASPPGDNGIQVTCQICEQNASLVELKLCVPTAEQAEAICSHWKEKSQNIYTYLLKELL